MARQAKIMMAIEWVHVSGKTGSMLMTFSVSEQSFSRVYKKAPALEHTVHDT